MKKQNENLTHDSPELFPYLTFFNRHLSQVRELLRGVSQKGTHEPSFINGVHWETTEKDAFFHALSVYSRLRPDLIAACIRTKNEVEVLEYMAALEEGSQMNLQNGERHRKSLLLAHEVSNAWLAWEEENALKLQANEKIWSSGYASNTIKDSGKMQDDSEGLRAQISELPCRLPLGGILHLTYGHLFVLDSILNVGINGVSDAARPNDADASSVQSMIKAGFTLPTRISHPSSSTTLDHSLTNSASIISQPDPGLDTGDERDPSSMSPRSRRRYQKRMHMRRKRAQATGREANHTMAKLPSGRRKKIGQDLAKTAIINGGKDTQDRGPEGTMDSTISAAQDSIDTRDQTPGSKTEGDDNSMFTMSGRRPFQTIRSEFNRHCIDKDSIADSGLDIFNYKKLGKLLRHFISGYDSHLSIEDATVNTEVPVLLAEILKDFLFQIISRAIVLEEEHRRSRGKTKVWRKNIDEEGSINKAAIQFALKTMGMTTENIEQYFAVLLGESHDVLSQQETEYDDNERPVSSLNVFHQHPLHQDIFLPHYRFAVQDHLRSPSDTEDGVDDLMDVITDDEELTKVFHQEETLDQEDVKADAAHENILWSEVPLPRKRSRSFFMEVSTAKEELGNAVHEKEASSEVSLPRERSSPLFLEVDTDEELEYSFTKKRRNPKRC